MTPLRYRVVAKQACLLAPLEKGGEPRPGVLIITELEEPAGAPGAWQFPVLAVDQDRFRVGDPVVVDPVVAVA